jgi:hypothetical protein
VHISDADSARVGLVSPSAGSMNCALCKEQGHTGAYAVPGHARNSAMYQDQNVCK